MLLVSDLVNVRWLTGFTGSNAAAVVGREGARRFVTDFRYLTQSAEEVDPAWEREIAVDLLAGVVKGLPGSGELRLAFDDAHMSVKDHARLAGMLRAGIELVPAGGAIEALRAVKDADELEAIRAAARLADDALTEVLGRGLVGRTEREVAWSIQEAFHELGAEGLSFPSIVAAHEHGAQPHAEPGDDLIGPDTLVTIDLGCVLDGYCSDCTRTFATGDVPAPLGEAYAVCLEAQLAAMEGIRAGLDCADADAIGRDVIAAAGLGEHFGHPLGHGVGLEVHEDPRLSAVSSATLEPGMVVTVEPGIYLPGLGGVRIEDLVIVTENGCERLTGYPKELTTLG